MPESKTHNEPIGDGELDGLLRLFDGQRHIGLAVSGGVDSCALMHLAARWRQHRGADAPRLTMLTVDHGLRPESGHEVEWVADEAATLGLEAAILRWQGDKPATGLQEAARTARYDLLAAYAHAHGLSAIATAHHLDDQAETLLMRLARGSGVDGLAAMPESTLWAGVPLLRPMLDLPKSRLIATMQQAGLSWIEDPSNDSSRFERNRLRRVWAELQALDFTPEALALSAKRMRRARAALETATDDFLSAQAQMAEAGYVCLPSRALTQAPEEIAVRAMGRLLTALGGQARAPRLARLEPLTTALQAGERSTRTLGGCRIVSDAETITILREPGRCGLPELQLDPGSTALWDRRFRVSAPTECPGPVTVRALGAAGLRQVLAQRPSAARPPHGAGADLVSFWRDRELVSVPHLGYHASQAAAQPRRPEGACAATFVNSTLIGQGQPAWQAPV